MPDITTVTDFDSRDVHIDPVTHEVRQAFQLVNYVILCGIISFFGIGANTINICVFVKQGFKDSINISLLGLAVSDLACSVTMFWGSICYNPLLSELDLPIAPLDVMYVSAALPHVCFNRRWEGKEAQKKDMSFESFCGTQRLMIKYVPFFLTITSFITAFITLERCLCIAMPLKVKIIITPFRTKVINISIFVSMVVLFCPFYFVQKLEWKYIVSRNMSILSIAFADDREIVDSITFFTHSVLLSSGLLLTVIVCTIVLVVKLNKKTKWRSDSLAQTVSKEDTVSTKDKEDTVSTKDKKVVKMITLIATIFIVCYIPPTVLFLIMTYNPDFSITGRLQNTSYTVWSVTFVLEAFNSSVNILVYLKMSSKFRDTFHDIFVVVPFCKI